MSFLDGIRLKIATFLLSGIIRLETDEVFYLKKYGETVFDDNKHKIISVSRRHVLLVDDKIKMTIGGASLIEAVELINRSGLYSIDLEHSDKVVNMWEIYTKEQ